MQYHLGSWDACNYCSLCYTRSCNIMLGDSSLLQVTHAEKLILLFCMIISRLAALNTCIHGASYTVTLSLIIFLWA
jgi:hypothetical protein